MKGGLFFLVGNSGSGKDSVLEKAKELWPKEKDPFYIPERVITRPPHPSEKFISVSEQEFREMQAHGKFCFMWKSYGLFYGIPRKILDMIHGQNIVIVNVSRQIIHEAKKQFPDLKIIFIKVPFAITKERILSRGREIEQDPVFQERIERAEKNQNLPEADFTIDNSGDLEAAGNQLRNYLLKYA